MKTFCLLTFVALMTAESQQINLNAKYGVLDCPESGCEDPLFAHHDVSTEIENKEIMDSLHEAEAEMKQQEKEKEEARMAAFEKAMQANTTSAANVTANTTANATITSNSTTNDNSTSQ